MSPHWNRIIITTLLVISLLCLLLAPLLMPASYNWILHTTSEAGAQGTEGAWLTRLAFMLFGFAVLLLALKNQLAWNRAARGLHATFGIGMIGNAVFSSRPWITELPYDVIEDFLHSLMSDLAGIAFTLGVIICLVKRKQFQWKSRYMDILAIFIAVFVTISMMSFDSIDGILQRVMFAVSYLWYLRETREISN